MSYRTGQSSLPKRVQVTSSHSSRGEGSRRRNFSWPPALSRCSVFSYPAEVQPNPTQPKREKNTRRRLGSNNKISCRREKKEFSLLYTAICLHLVNFVDFGTPIFMLSFLNPLLTLFLLFCSYSNFCYTNRKNKKVSHKTINSKKNLNKDKIQKSPYWNLWQS